MRKNILSKAIVALLALFIFVACKPKQLIVQTPPETAVIEEPTLKPEEKLELVRNGELKFNTLSMKAKAGLSISGNSNDVSMNIRIKNNEAIWVSITALAGIEVARALITPDSVKIINRLENVYIVKPFSYIHEFSNETLSFETLQSVLLGNPLAQLSDTETKVDMTKSPVELRTVLGSMLYLAEVNDENKIARTVLDDNSRKQQLDVSYSGFQALGNQRVPNRVSLNSVANNKEIKLDLEFTRVEIDVDASMPFKAPDKFTIKN